MKQVTIYTPIELRNLRKDKLKASQQELAIIMGLSENSYMSVCKYENGEDGQLISWKSWENLQDYLKLNKIKVK